MTDVRPVRVFISSPEDVRPERGIAARVIQRLAREFSYHFKVEAVLWEREPLLASDHFQDRIMPPRDTDIVVVLLWSRLGLPLPRDKYAGALSGREVTGTEWEFEDALAGHRQRQLPALLLYRKRADIVVKLGDRQALDEQQRQTELVEDFMRRWFSSADGKSVTAAFWTFTDGAAFEAMLEDHLRALLRQRLEDATAGEAPATMRWHRGSPYRGLEAFEPEHEPIFFGRTRARNEVRELLARQAARGAAFVLVMGSSGSGKSSLVKAGVLPVLCEAGMVGRTALVRHAIARPGAFTAPGTAISGVAAALFAASALPELGVPPLQYTRATLADMLRKAPEDAPRPIGQGLAAAGRAAGVTGDGEARLLLVIDQLEELFTAEAITPDDRERYIAALEALATSGAVWVIATLRSDFFDRLERLPALARLAGEGTYLLTPPDVAEIGQIVRQPAREAGLTFEVDDKSGRSLADDICEAAAGDAASLPLLEYLLDQLWHRRSERGVLGFAAYHALGGLEGAIGRRADAVLADLPADVQAALPRLLRALVTVRPGAGTAATARPAPIEQFPQGSAARRLIEALLAPQARLLVADGGTLRLAHEALLTHWPRARDQIAEDRADLQLRSRLEDMAGRWQAAAVGAPKDTLLLRSGLPLSEADDLLQRRREELDTTLVQYVEQSATAARRRQRRATARMRIVAAVMTVLATGAGIGTWQAIESGRRARTSLDQALTLVDKVMIETVAELQDNRVQPYVARAILNHMLPVLEILEREQSSVAPVRRWEVLIYLHDLHQAAGDTREALRQAAAARELAAGFAKREPADVLWQHRLADSHIAVGDAEAADNPAAALASYRNGADILDTLARREHPLKARWQNALASTHEKIGDALSDLPAAQQRLSEALDAYRFSLSILAQQTPPSPDWQRVAVVNHKIGTVLLKQGRASEARDAQITSLAIAQRQQPYTPANAAFWLGHVTMVHRALGDIAMAQNDPRAALADFRKSVEVIHDLLDRDSGNTGLRDLLAVGYARIVAAAEAAGDRDAAVDAARAGRASLRVLLQQQPDHPWWQKGEAWFADRLRALGAE